MGSKVTTLPPVLIIFFYGRGVCVFVRAYPLLDLLGNYTFSRLSLLSELELIPAIHTNGLLKDQLHRLINQAYTVTFTVTESYRCSKYILNKFKVHIHLSSAASISQTTLLNVHKSFCLSMLEI